MNLKIGDLCWAKIRGYPLWPGKIIPGPDTEKNHYMGSSKLRHYIHFFGSGDYAWVDAKKIEPNSEEAMKKASQIKRLRKAIEQLKTNMRDEKYYLQGIVKKCRVVVKPLTTSHIAKINSLTINEVLSLESCYSNGVTNPPNKIQKTENNSLNENINVSDKSILSRKKKPKKFGFIGNGEIGKEMLKNLQKSKCEITIYSETLKEYDLDEVQVHQTACTFLNLFVSCDIIVCCMDSEDKVEYFFKGREGILRIFESYPSEGKGFVLLANVDLQDWAETAAKITASGGRFVGAPFIGTKNQAAKGDLLILCSGDHTLFNDCKVAFSGFERIKYLGLDIEFAPKLITVIGLFLNSVGKSYKETTRLIQALGLPLPIFNGLLKTVIGGKSMTALCHDPLEKIFSQDDRIRFFLKDLGLKNLLEVNFPK